MRQLIVIPGNCQVLGGNALSLSLMIRGFERCGASQQIRVVVQANTLLEKYLQQAGQGFCLQVVQEQNLSQFLKRAFKWVNQQPREYPLLLENYTDRHVLPLLLGSTPALRFSRRPIYHIFRDQALSFNPFGNLLRKVTFTCLAPHILCNSQFTAGAIDGRLGNVEAILYPPVDREQFNNLPPSGPPPKELQSILLSGSRIILTPSRISAPDQLNDKNLRSLIPVLAQLKSLGYHYHGVVIGQDSSPNRAQTHALLEQAECLGVADRFTILAPTFTIQDYYKYADIVVSLAPREPFGRTIVEAVACGVPVAGSRTGGIGEILHNFAPEWTVDPQDPGAIARAITHIVADPNTTNTLAKGKRWVESQCSTQSYARRIMEITGVLTEHRV